jgi:hypothetical protein
MSDWYELIGQSVVKMDGDVLECAMRFEQMERRVASTVLFDMCTVSTIFLGLDYGWGGGPPMVFETMAFWGDEGGYEQERCSTWLQAQEQHARMCADAVRPRSVLAYVYRNFRSYCDRASRNLGRRWREVCGIELTDSEKMLDRLLEEE